MAQQKGLVADTEGAIGITPVGDRVVIRFTPVEKKEKKTKSGLVLPGQDEEGVGQTYGGSQGQKHRAIIEAMGPDVDPKKVGFDVGDWVIFNNYDLMAIDFPDPENPTETITFGLTKPDSIWGIFKTD